MKKYKRLLVVSTIILAVLAASSFMTLSRLEARQQKAASHFFLNDVRGAGYDSRKALGRKPLLIIFSTTWCPACNAYLPEFKKFYSRYTPRGVDIIGINIGESLPKVINWVVKNNVPYRVLIDENQNIAKRYGIMGVPGMVLINEKGDIICNPCRSFTEIEKALD